MKLQHSIKAVSALHRCCNFRFSSVSQGFEAVAQKVLKHFSIELNLSRVTLNHFEKTKNFSSN